MQFWHNKFDLDKTFFTSDLHFHHKNLCRGVSNWEDTSSCRDFDTLDDMNHAILTSINENVGQDDTLFCLGDWSFGSHTKVGEFRKRIYCENVILLYGNHDDKIRKLQSLQKYFAWCGDYLEIACQKEQGLKVPSLITLSHYAHRVWRDSHKGTIELHGHSHGTLPGVGKSFDMGWDVWEKPVSLRHIINSLEDIEINHVDHHRADFK